MSLLCLQMIFTTDYNKYKPMRSARVNAQQEIEAMNVICNIQMMQQKVYGESFAYDQFNDNTLEELRTLQDKMIVEYNNSFVS
jgi:hypothetical protein